MSLSINLGRFILTKAPKIKNFEQLWTKLDIQNFEAEVEMQLMFVSSLTLYSTYISLHEQSLIHWVMRPHTTSDNQF